MNKNEHSGSTALVCVDSYENSVPVGRLYHPDSGGETPFSCMVHLLHALDSLPEKTGGPSRLFQGATWPPLRCVSSSARMPAGRAPLPGWNRAARSGSAALWNWLS